MDFDILLESVYPHKQFTVFLRNRRPDLLPYLQVIRKSKLLKAKQGELDAMLMELQLASDEPLHRDGSASSGNSTYSNDNNINSEKHKQESPYSKFTRKVEK